MSAQTETVERESQATPLAEDVLGLLRQQIEGARMGTTGGPGQTPQQRQGALDANAFGMGVGPLQREAGTSMRQLLNSLEGGGIGVPQEQRAALEQVQTNQRERALADLGEQFGMAGSSLGTPQSVGQARLLSELVPRQTQQLFEEGRARQGQLMQAIMGMQQLGQQNVEPFFQMARQGILPEEVVVKEHPLVSGLGAVSGLGKGAGSFLQGFNDRGGGRVPGRGGGGVTGGTDVGPGMPLPPSQGVPSSGPRLG